MQRWYSLPAAQKLVGLAGTRGKRLYTFLRKKEREENALLIREVMTPSGRVRREVGEWTLYWLFPDAFKEELGEIARSVARARAEVENQEVDSVRGHAAPRFASLIRRRAGR
jgi:hypothetical protein